MPFGFGGQPTPISGLHLGEVFKEISPTFRFHGDGNAIGLRLFSQVTFEELEANDFGRIAVGLIFTATLRT